MFAPGLRDRKRQRTRRAIATAALRLFTERGFDRTTISAITEAADVSRRTFFTYFATKEDAVFWDFDQRLDSLQQALSRRPSTQSVLALVRDWLTASVRAEPVNLERERLEARLISEVPAVAARSLQLYNRIEDVLAHAIADESGADADDVAPRMAAAAATAWLRTLGRMVGEADHGASFERQLRDEPLSLMTPMFAFIEGGLAAVQSNSGRLSRSRRRAPSPPERRHRTQGLSV